MSKYKGVVVEESLEDSRVVNGLEVLRVIISGQENPAERWHLYTVRASEEEIERLSENIREGWYMHFWNGRHVVAVFRSKRFEFEHDDKVSWKPAVEYGLSVGIPDHQLDFPID